MGTHFWFLFDMHLGGHHLEWDSFMDPFQARESFVITTGVDTKLGSAPKSKAGESPEWQVFLFGGFLKWGYPQIINF